MIRRNFIKSVPLLPFIGKALISTNETNEKLMGINLEKLSTFMINDPVNCIETIAKIGAKHLEIGNYNEGLFYGLTIPFLNKLCHDNGLSIVSIATKTFIRPELLQKTIDSTLQLGAKYLVNEGLGNVILQDESEAKRMSEILNKNGILANQAGLKYCHHHTRFEFNNKSKVLPFDVLLKNTDASLVFFEIDSYYFQIANQNLIYYFMQYPNRFPLWRLNDCMIVKEQPLPQPTEIGKGMIDFKSILKNSNTSGFEYGFVQMGSADESIYTSIKTSLDFLKSI